MLIQLHVNKLLRVVVTTVDFLPHDLTEDAVYDSILVNLDFAYVKVIYNWLISSILIPLDLLPSDLL